MNTAYEASHFANNLDDEIRRLNAQVALFWPHEGDLLTQAGLRNGMSVLDIGCGPGHLIGLIKERFPNCRISGLERDPLLVTAAEQYLASQQLAGCQIFQGAAESPPLPEGSFDFITMRLVLEHVSKPEVALAAVKALLKPDGLLAVISNDFDFHLRTWPQVNALQPLYQAYCTARRDDGGDPTIGRRVPQLLQATGYSLVFNRLEMAHNAELGDEPFLRAEGVGIPAQLVKSGYLAQAAFDELARDWKSMLDTPGHVISRQLWLAVGRNCAAASAQVEAPSARQVKAAVDLPLPDRAALLTLIRQVLDDDLLDADDTLSDAGIDSVSAIILQDAIKNLTSVEIPILTLLDNLGVDRLWQLVSAGSRVTGPAVQGTNGVADEGEL
ncbi:methyltransferase family protein [Teredinibacter turnerae T7901]|uniref:Methyltransferase family protein n=1 Tax=Teredinibacter turnerae (strain ATCC 39867 / T7901) TaxID=377629 RepID=C5BIB2_TERTT|nr:class I SAM-dependent methyltransferase [Teredinibacter turnerae]ACR14797.1 methyltransferase family protein [Teredinibacter turnerae T7901]